MGWKTTAFNVIFAILLIGAWIYTGGLMAQASTKLHGYKNVNDELNDAYWFAFWSAFVTWFLVGLFLLVILLGILGVIGLFATGIGEVATITTVAATTAEGAAVAGASGGDAVKTGVSAISTGVSWITLALLGVALVLVTITGVLAAMAASKMVKGNFDSSNEDLKKAYNDCVISASVCLGAAGLIVIGFIVYFIMRMVNKKQISTKAEIQQKQEALALQIEESNQAQLDDI